MSRLLVSLAAGLLFGLGLIVSEMIDPERVLGFLNIFGDWDPRLAFVMAGAVIVNTLGILILKRRSRPLLESHFDWPSKTDIDRPLVMGAVLFGVGWGLIGLCPGPAIAGLGTGLLPVLLFVLAMLVGMLVAKAITGLVQKLVRP